MYPLYPLLSCRLTHLWLALAGNLGLAEIKDRAEALAAIPARSYADLTR